MLVVTHDQKKQNVTEHFDARERVVSCSELPKMQNFRSNNLQFSLFLENADPDVHVYMLVGKPSGSF